MAENSPTKNPLDPSAIQPNNPSEPLKSLIQNNNPNSSVSASSELSNPQNSSPQLPLNPTQVPLNSAQSLPLNLSNVPLSQGQLPLNQAQVPQNHSLDYQQNPILRPHQPQLIPSSSPSPSSSGSSGFQAQNCLVSNQPVSLQRSASISRLNQIQAPYGAGSVRAGQYAQALGQFGQGGQQVLGSLARSGQHIPMLPTQANQLTNIQNQLLAHQITPNFREFKEGHILRDFRDT